MIKFTQKPACRSWHASRLGDWKPRHHKKAPL